MSAGAEHLSTGEWGEAVAARFLERMGYRILGRRVQVGSRDELDLVARDRDILVFVEVKTRRGRAMGSPEEGLTPRKGEKLMTLAQIYVADHQLDVDWRVDLVAVELDESGKLLRCEHIPNAVLGW